MARRSVERYHRRNSTIMVVSVVFWAFGISCLWPETVLQSMLVDAGASTTVIGLLLAIGSVRIVPTILSPFFVRKMRRTRVLVGVCWSASVLPYALLGVVLLMTGSRTGAAVWVPLVVAHAFFVLMAGFISPIGHSYSSRMLLPSQRGRVMGRVHAVRGVVGMVGGLATAWWVAREHESCYPVLLIVGGMSAAMWGVIWMRTVEPVKNEPTDVAGLRDYVRDLRLIVTREPAFRYAVLLLVAIYITTASTDFVTEYALRPLGGAKSLTGQFTAARFFGNFAGVLAAGWLSDRISSAVLPAASAAFSVVALGLLTLTTDPDHLVGIMVIQGAAQGALLMGQVRVVWDLCPRKNKASHSAIMFTSVLGLKAVGLVAATRLIVLHGHLAVFRWSLIALVPVFLSTIRFAFVSHGAARRGSDDDAP